MAQHQARLISAQQTSTRINNLPVVELVLEIEVPGRASYSVRHRAVLGMETAHKLSPGTRFPVRVDPRDQLVVSVQI